MIHFDSAPLTTSSGPSYAAAPSASDHLETPREMLVCPLCRVALDPTETTCPRDGREGEEQRFDQIEGDLAERFDVVQPFGKGATGTLYLADEKQTGRRGILKILHSETGVSTTERQRLKRELVKQATLSNPHLALPLVTGESGGRMWLFREWVEGVSLRVRLSRGGKLAAPEALAIAAQLAEALDELHRAGLLHRDLSPNHVLLHPQPSGVPKVVVIDAGIAARVEGTTGFDIAGTPGYISPEQATGKLVSFRSDLYALGALLYEMLEGRPLYTADDESALIEAHASQPIPTMPSNIPSGVQQLVTQLLSKDPRERPFSAQQSKRVIEPFLPESKGQRDPTVSFVPQDSPAAQQPDANGSGTLRPPKKKMTIMGMPAVPPQPNKPPPPPPEQAARASQPVASRPPPPPGERTSAAPKTDGANGASKKRISSVPPPTPADALKNKNVGKSADSTEELDALDLEPVEAPVIAAAPPTSGAAKVAPPTAPAPSGGVAPVPVGGGDGDLDYDDLAETTAMDRGEAEQKLGVPGAVAAAPVAGQPVRQTAPGFPAPGSDPQAQAGAPQAAAPQAAAAPLASAPGSSPQEAAAFDQAAQAIEQNAVPPTAEMPMQPGQMQGQQPMQPVMEPVKLPTKSRLPLILGVLGVGFCLVSAGVIGGGYYLWSSAQEELATSFEGLEEVDLAPEIPSPDPVPAPETTPGQIELSPTPSVTPEPAVEPEPVAEAEPEPEPVAEAREEREERSERSSMRSERGERSQRSSSMERSAMGGSGGNDLESLRSQAREAWRAGNFRGAAEAYQRATAIAPRNAGAWMGLGSARYRLREYRGAVEAYQHAVEINPRNSGYMASLGRALLAAGNRNGARQAYQRALALDPNNAAARQALERM
jgi:serine/threonine-protein kinase